MDNKKVLSDKTVGLKPSGIRNIQEMLALTHSGTLEVFSAPNRQGTLAIVQIHKY